MVSSSSTTGTKNISKDSLKGFKDKIKKLNLRNPQLIGFGIKDKATFNNVCQHASGGIIGTAFIKALDWESDMISNIHKFISDLK